MIKIEKGIPLPQRYRRQPLRAEDCPYPFTKMEAGDSFVLVVAPNDTAKRLAVRLRKWARIVGSGAFSLTIQIAPDEKSARVWRVSARPGRPRKPKPLANLVPTLIGASAPRVHRLSDEEPKGKRA